MQMRRVGEGNEVTWPSSFRGPSSHHPTPPLPAFLPTSSCGMRLGHGEEGRTHREKCHVPCRVGTAVSDLQAAWDRTVRCVPAITVPGTQEALNKCTSQSEACPCTSLPPVRQRGRDT